LGYALIHSNIVKNSVVNLYCIHPNSASMQVPIVEYLAAWTQRNLCAHSLLQQRPGLALLLATTPHHPVLPCFPTPPFITHHCITITLLSFSSSFLTLLYPTTTPRRPQENKNDEIPRESTFRLRIPLKADSRSSLAHRPAARFQRGWNSCCSSADFPRFSSPCHDEPSSLRLLDSIDRPPLEYLIALERI
jgi:hypothetical protein